MNKSLSSISLFLILTSQESLCSLIPGSPSLTASEWLEGILTPLGPPSSQKMDCIASDNRMDKFGEFFQVLFKRTWPKNVGSLLKFQATGKQISKIYMKCLKFLDTLPCLFFLLKKPLGVRLIYVELAN